MKRNYLFGLLLCISQWTTAQNPGLVISEALPNPAGTDSPFEWIELVATANIDFSVTPYSVVVCNNGTATTNGWIAGGAVSYGFNITTGTVTAGQVVYVGGSTMAPTGTKLRVINTGTTGGDGFGTANAAGIVGNGGANVDGIAVFNLLTTSLTNASVPVDAIFYGTAIGTALVNAGADGYQLPVNDRYAGGKLQSGSFFAGDPGSDVSIRATGFFNTASNSWFGTRSWTTQTPTNDNGTLISQGTTNPPGSASIVGVTQTVSETAGTATVNISFINANTDPARIAITLSTYTNATQGTDFTFVSDSIIIPANTNGTFPFTINLTNDLLAERAERIIVKLGGTINALTTGNTYQIIYLTDNDYQAPVSTNELSMSLLSTFSNGAEGTNSAEIVAFDETTDRLYIVNSIGAKMDIVNFANPSAPTLISTIPISAYGNINSLVVHNGVVALAIENTVPEQNGFVVFLNQNGTFISQVTVCALPDMITFNKDFTKVVTACEGQPNSNYTIDPEGAIGIVDLTPGIAALTNANVSIAGFTAFNGQLAALRAQGVRIFGPGSSVAQDMEPEYITINDDNQTATVSLQENNAFAIVNLNTATVTEIRPLGYIDYSGGNNGMDFSDQTTSILISSIPVKGMYQPDAIAHATIGGTEYVFSANEGDAREYGAALTEVGRLATMNLDATVFPDQAILKNNQFLGRLNVLTPTADFDADGDLDEIQVQGGRSFSVWNATTGALVYDSKDLLEQLTANHPTLGALFNASNTSGTAVSKNRSDDKGPEPEGVSTAFINGNNYLFVSLERIGGVIIFNIDNPATPIYSGYFNNRSGSPSGPDRGAEGIISIDRSISPNGKDLVILANEISSTLSVYQVNTCVDLAGAIISAPIDSICQGQTATLSIPGSAQSSVQWLLNNSPIVGATGNSIVANQTGDYRVYVSNSTLMCADTTLAQRITVNPLPLVGAGADQSVCMGTSVTLSGSGAQTYTWNNGITNTTAFTPASTLTYTVTGTAVNGCQNTDQVVVTVKSLPSVSAGIDQSVCTGNAITLEGLGAVSFTWNNGITNNMAFTPTNTLTYTVTGTGVNGCQNTDQVVVTVNTVPVVDAGINQTICFGETATLSGSGAVQFAWDNGISNATSFTPTATQTYTVTGTDANGCTDTDQAEVVVNQLPIVSAGLDVSVCEGETAILSGSGAQSYLWSDGVVNNIGFVPTATQTYSVTGTDANGCENSDQVVVSVNTTPLVNAGNNQSVCLGSAVILQGTGTPGTTYTWNNSVINGVAFNPTGTQTYTVTGTSNGCEGSDQVIVTVNSLPTVSLGADTTVCANNAPVVLNAGTGFTSYQWNNNATTQTTNANVSGTYEVTVTNANGCSNSDAIIVTIDPCLGLLENGLSFSISPNPSTGMVTVQSTSNKPVQVIVHDLSGKRIDSFESTNGQLIINLSTVAEGTYLFQIQQGTTIQTERIVITH